MADILEVYTVNAFVADNQGGNMAGVVLNADGLKVAQMQRIAADLAFSETAFILKSKKANYKVRFFTPTEEVNFCGHATVGVFATLFHTKRVEPGNYTQETKAGLLAVEVSSEGRITMDQATPQFGEELTAEAVAPLFGIQAEDILSTGLPVKVVSTGLADIIVPVCDESVLNALQPDFAAINAFSKQHKAMAIHAFALTPTESDISARCRNFAPRVGINEESATGSAAGALASYLHVYQGGKYRYLFEQGEILNRRSLLSAKVDSSEHGIERVAVGGLSDKPQRIPYRLAEEATP
ncbi:PhzF family phenazine biosynthesis protein [Enterovibrio sp. ZSDZ35]|uniref:PhzF family phenazine biosynthesis protein n=1 Tax=Enterovibrio qingdaonensis TaxID=2899818 RepID=A0ABT5QFM9_9GAMM|nr:PhzF family phenazine biosynthesis protein [Enterovibrio sp. ZSDZ35]MDD1779787.1 PhzF family phenazine biosynthesis protein [Enterovibrio sp. ZSDZ35]